MKRLASHLSALISVVSATVALIIWLTSKSVRTWVRLHSGWVYAGLVVATLIAFLAIDLARSSNRKYRELEASRKVVSDHDKQLFQKILMLIPLEGDVMNWLKKEFFVKQIPTRLVNAANQTSRRLSLHPVGFDNSQMNDAYRELIAAIDSFNATIMRWTRYEDNSRANLSVPLSMMESERGEEKYYSRLEEIEETVKTLVGAYDGFLETCQRCGISIYDPEHPT